MTVSLGDSIIESSGDLYISSGADVKHLYNASQINIGTSSGTDGFLTVGADGKIFADSVYTTAATSNGTGYRTYYLINEALTGATSNVSTTSTTYSIASSSQMQTYTPLKSNSRIQVYITLSCGIQKTGTDNDAQGNFSAIFVDETGAAKSTTKRIGFSTWNEDAFRLVILNNQWTAAIGTNRTSLNYRPAIFVETFATSDWINSDGTIRIAPYYRVYPDTSAGYTATATIYSCAVSWLEFA